MADNKKTIAFFDFDGTLAQGDSLWPFLLAAAGRRCCYMACAQAFLAWTLCPAHQDKRSIFKDVLLRHTLAGRSLHELAEAAKKIELWPRWIEPTCLAIQKHHEQGHHIVIASGSLDLYLKSLLKSLPYDAILCTEIEVKDGHATGAMPLGNCVRERKAERVEAYMKQHGPFDDSIVYGNLPHDLPMMDKVKRRVIV